MASRGPFKMPRWKPKARAPMDEIATVLYSFPWDPAGGLDAKPASVSEPVDLGSRGEAPPGMFLREGQAGQRDQLTHGSIC